VKARIFNFELEVLPKSYYKRKIQKPYFEFDYFFIDAVLRTYDEDGVPVGEERYLEIEYLGKCKESFSGMITVNEILMSKEVTYFRIKNIVQNFLLDYESYSSKHRFDEDIKAGLGIEDKNFHLSDLLYKIYEQIEDKQIENLNKEIETQFLYEPFFFKAGESVLVSKMGEGKTVWVLSMLYRLQNGLPLIQFDRSGIFKDVINYYIEPCNVVYLAFEGNKAEILSKKEEIKNWIQKEAEIIKGNSEIKDFYIELLMGDIIKKVNRKRIREILSVLNPKFIVIDSVTSAFLSFSSVDKTHLIYSFIRETFISKGIGVMLLMHPSKQDIRDESILPRGTIHHLAIPRVVWGLEQTEETPEGFVVKIRSIKDNLGLKKNSYKFKISFYYDATSEEKLKKVCEVSLIEIIDEKAKEQNITEKILYYLENKTKDKSASIAQIAEYYKLDAKKVGTILSKLAKKGIVSNVGRGKYALSIKEEKTENIKVSSEIKNEDDNIPF